MSVCDAMLLPNCASYQLCTTAVLVPDPGSKAQALHREDQLWNLPSPHPVIEVASMWAITDFTRENGATHLVPGSNLWWAIELHARTRSFRRRWRAARCCFGLIMFCMARARTNRTPHASE